MGLPQCVSNTNTLIASFLNSSTAISLQSVTAIRLVLNLHLAGHRREMHTELTTRSTFLYSAGRKSITPLVFANNTTIGDLGELLEPSANEDDVMELQPTYEAVDANTNDCSLLKNSNDLDFKIVLIDSEADVPIGQ